jgi:hypothetical protein
MLAGGLLYTAGALSYRRRRQDFTDGAFPGDGLGQWQVRLDVVPVTPAVFLLDQVAALDEVRDDAEGAAFGDVQAGRDVTQAHLGVVGHAQEHQGMIGQEGPARHVERIPVTGKNLLVSCCEYSVRPGTGHQPLTTASFPGYRRSSRQLNARSAACSPLTSSALIGRPVIYPATYATGLSLTSRTGPGGQVIAALRGDLDIASAPALREQLIDLLRPAVSAWPPRPLRSPWCSQRPA